jgi:hypothetical protein
MFMKRILLTIFIIAGCLTSFAKGIRYDNLQDKAWVGMSVGYNMFMFEDDNNNTSEVNAENLSFNIGRHFQSSHIEGVFGITTSAEGTIANSIGVDTDVKYSNMHAMLNYGFDIPMDENGRLVLSPLFGAGFVKWDLDITSQGNTLSQRSEINFIWQLGSKARFMLTESHSIDFTALYVRSEVPEDYEADINMKKDSVSLTLGYKYWF